MGFIKILKTAAAVGAVAVVIAAAMVVRVLYAGFTTYGTRNEKVGLAKEFGSYMESPEAARLHAIRSSLKPRVPAASREDVATSSQDPSADAPAEPAVSEERLESRIQRYLNESARSADAARIRAQFGMSAPEEFIALLVITREESTYTDSESQLQNSIMESILRHPERYREEVEGALAKIQVGGREKEQLSMLLKTIDNAQATPSRGPADASDPQ